MKRLLACLCAFAMLSFAASAALTQADKPKEPKDPKPPVARSQAKGPTTPAKTKSAEKDAPGKGTAPTAGIAVATPGKAQGSGAGQPGKSTASPNGSGKRPTFKPSKDTQ